MKHTYLGLLILVLLSASFAIARPQAPPFILPPDLDGDGIPNGLDNCFLRSNADQLDSDGDELGDACDPDDDDDSISDGDDNCPLVANADQTDIDRDEIGDACDDAIIVPHYGLEDYPTMFVTEGRFNGRIVIGENAPAPHMLFATRIAQGMRYRDQFGNRLAPRGVQRSMVLDDEIELDDIFDQNLIVIGNACVNAITRELQDNPEPCTDDLQPNQGRIQIFQQDGIVAIVVSGFGTKTTKVAADVLAHYEDYQGTLRGREVTIETDVVDDLPAEPEEDPVPPAVTDGDGDGVPNSLDNCPLVANPPVNGVQPDADHDGLGDACDNAPGQPANPPPQTEDVRFKELQDKFNAFDDDYDEFKDKYEDAQRDKDDRDIRKYKNKLEDLDDDLDKLGDDVQDFIDEIEDDRAKGALQDKLENLDEDIDDLRKKIRGVLNPRSEQPQSNLQDNTYMQPSVPRTAPAPAPTGGVTVRMDPTLLPPVPSTTSTTEESTNLTPLAWLVAGIVVVGAVLVFLLALLLKK